jgi:hypothetical protein
MSLNDTSVRNLAGISSGAISILSLLGKSYLTLNTLSVQNYGGGAAYGFSDGGGFDGPPYSDQTFGSLAGASIGGYTTNALYSYTETTGDPDSGYVTVIETCWITRSAYGDGVFNGRSIGIYSGSTLIDSSVLTYQYDYGDGTQTYFLANTTFFAPYSGQGISIGLI